MKLMDPAVAGACEDFGRYIGTLVEPAMNELLTDADRHRMRLHQVFAVNTFLAHAVDYLAAIRSADGISETRTDLVRSFDEKFSVEGARFANHKFELIDAINNSLKHIELDPTRYKKVITKYGQITFGSLVEEGGAVMCLLDGYRFDYTRVVLRPAFKVFFGLGTASATSILEFARGEAFVEEWSSSHEPMSSSDPTDAIDQMIEYCNPTCSDCGERELSCQCSRSLYAGETGRFAPEADSEFDFDEVMSRISGAYRRNG